MLIEVVCTNCDAVLKAPESVLGKRVKCKKCDEVFVAQRAIEAADDDEPPAKMTKMKSPPPPVKRKSRDDDDDSGDEVPVAKSKKSTRKHDDDDERPVKRSRVVEDEDDEYDDEPRPKKKGKKGKKPTGPPVMLFVLIGVGALLLLGGGAVGVYHGFIKEDKPTSTSGTGGGTGTTSKPGGGPGPAPVNLTAGWVDVNDDDGRFTIKFPQKPQSQTVRQPGPAGLISVKVYLLPNPNEVFVCGQQAIPANRVGITDEQVLEQAVTGGMQQTKGGQITSTKSLTYQGFPAREVVGTLGGKKGGTMVLRVVLAGDRLIIMNCIAESLTGDSPRVKAFFESLKIN